MRCLAIPRALGNDNSERWGLLCLATIGQAWATLQSIAPCLRSKLAGPEKPSTYATRSVEFKVDTNSGVVRVGRVATPSIALHEMGQTGFQKTSTAMACHHAPYTHLQEVAGCLATSKVFILQTVQNVPGVSCPLLAKQ